MSVYRLDERPVFPDPQLADPSGLIAVDGDLSPERLLTAYASGIFPWYSEGQPILWFSPDPRMVLLPERLRVSRGIRRTLDRNHFELTMDEDFSGVISGCAHTRRRGQDGTWITDDMIEAYCRLHALGFAHSVEARADGELVGGVYGVSVGGYFAAESMFHVRDGASMAALIALVRQLGAWGFELLDLQLHTPHLARLGGEEWPRARFLAALAAALEAPTQRGRWAFADR